MEESQIQRVGKQIIQMEESITADVSQKQLLETDQNNPGNNGHTSRQRENKVDEHNEKLWVYVHVALFAIFGCLIRVGLDHLTGGELADIEKSQSVVFKSFFSNILGSFLLGVLVSSGLKKNGKLQHLYTGISTGLCGSITTYSKWNQQVSLLLIGEGEANGNSQLIGITAIYVGMTTFLCSFQMGKNTFIGHRKRDVEVDKQYFKMINNERWRRLSNIIILIALAVCIIILIVCTSAFRSDGFALTLFVSALFAPLGANSRLLFGKFNGKYPAFLSHKLLQKVPLGTLLANLMGSLLISLSHVFVTWVSLTCGALAAVRAFQGGFVACLTTVSTFMSEVSSLRQTNVLASYVYITITITLCQSIACLTNGISYAILQHNLNTVFNMTYSDYVSFIDQSC